MLLSERSPGAFSPHHRAAEHGRFTHGYVTTDEIYESYPHGMLTTHADVLNPDILAFIRS